MNSNSSNTHWEFWLAMFCIFTLLGASLWFGLAVNKANAQETVQKPRLIERLASPAPGIPGTVEQLQAVALIEDVPENAALAASLGAAMADEFYGPLGAVNMPLAEIMLLTKDGPKCGIASSETADLGARSARDCL